MVVGYFSSGDSLLAGLLTYYGCCLICRHKVPVSIYLEGWVCLV